jgi:hypothetical protein
VEHRSNNFNPVNPDAVIQPVGSLVYNPAMDRYETWMYHAKATARTTFMWSTPSRPFSEWEKVSETPIWLDEEPPEGALDPWYPVGVSLLNGRYFTWFLALDSAGDRALFRATSDDGILWHPDSEPSLQVEPGGPQFEADGFTNAVATWTGEVWVMAYTGSSVTEKSAVGIAVSDGREGTRWVRYHKNPLVSPACGRMDDRGVTVGTVDWTGDGLTVWYGGTGSRPLECPEVRALEAAFVDSIFRVDLPILFSGDQRP